MKAESHTSEHSTYSTKLKIDRQELIKDEAQIYLKLGNTQEAIRVAREIVSKDPSNIANLAEVLPIFMQANALEDAEQILDLMEKESNTSLIYLENRASFEVQVQRYAKAAKVYEILIDKYPQSLEHQIEYIRVLNELGSSRKAYRLTQALNSKQAEAFLPTDVQAIAQKGADSIEIHFDHIMGPGGLQSIKGQSSYNFWVDDFYKFKIISTHRYVTRDGREGADSVNDYIPGTKVQAEYASGNFWSAGAGIGSEFYLDRAFTSPSTYIRYDNGRYEGEFRVEWDKLVGDPIEAIDRIGRSTDINYNQAYLIQQGLSVRHEMDLKILTVDRFANTINGDESLGYRITNLYGIDYTLLDQPYVSLFYNYVHGRWAQSVDGIEVVIPYLEDESRHTYGFYSEVQITKDLKFISTIGHGRDRKRDVHLTVYVGGFEYLWNEENLFKFNYEYDFGDSGTLGSGNTTVITASYARYF